MSVVKSQPTYLQKAGHRTGGICRKSISMRRRAISPMVFRAMPSALLKRDARTSNDQCSTVVTRFGRSAFPRSSGNRHRPRCRMPAIRRGPDHRPFRAEAEVSRAASATLDLPLRPLPGIARARRGVALGAAFREGDNALSRADRWPRRARERRSDPARNFRERKDRFKNVDGGRTRLILSVRSSANIAARRSHTSSSA